MSKSIQWRPWIEMTSTIPFSRSKGRTKVLRDLEVSRSYSLSDKFGIDDIGKDINLKVIWYQGDRRDQSILTGQSREQNVIVDVVNLLTVIKEMFPDYKITFIDPHSPAAPVSDHSL